MDNIPYQDMQFLFTGELPTAALDKLSTVLAASVQTQQQLAQTLQQNNEAIIQAMQQLTETLQRPRKLITDKTGKPIGSELA